RCDLIVIANGRKEKIASGLLNPFVAHLKAAQDQIAKGGYTILLEPDPGADAPWFTRGTVERFVRFVSTPEVLERVTTIESEILQLEDAIAVQSNENLGLKSGEGHNGKPVDSSMEGTGDTTTDFISECCVAQSQYPRRKFRQCLFVTEKNPLLCVALSLDHRNFLYGDRTAPLF
uniref:Uncharacterized protein n=1 Tax=Aegilops tauschii subsp. strangulata TaxID=200361 RepID=A0A453MMN3_AEGTS